MSFARGTRVLVTGSSGQLGTELQKSCPAGIEITPVDVAELDIGDRAAVLDTVGRLKPALIINGAAHTAVDKAEVEKALAFRVNGEAPGHLAEAANACGARLLHISTDYVFDGTACSPYAPYAKTNPINVYGASKLAGERAVLERAERALIVRTAWVYARGGNNFVNTMTRLMRERDEVRVIADQVGTPTHAASLARALWQLAARPDVSGIHHWTDAGVASWYDFAVAIEALQRKNGGKAVKVTPVTTADYPLPARRPAYGVLDKSSAFALIGPARHWQAELVNAFSGEPQ